MQRINALFGKRVINQATGDRVASVHDVVLSSDARRIVALVVSEGGRTGNEQVVPWESVISVGEFVIVDGKQPWRMLSEHAEVLELREQAQQITGKPIMSAAGERLGTVGDVLYNERGEIVSYELKQGLFGGSSDAPLLPAASVQAIGKDAIIASSGELIGRDELEPDGHIQDVDHVQQHDQQHVEHAVEQGNPRVRVYTHPLDSGEQG